MLSAREQPSLWWPRAAAGTRRQKAGALETRGADAEAKDDEADENGPSGHAQVAHRRPVGG